MADPVALGQLATASTAYLAGVAVLGGGLLAISVTALSLQSLQERDMRRRVEEAVELARDQQPALRNELQQARELIDAKPRSWGGEADRRNQPWVNKTSQFLGALSENGKLQAAQNRVLDLTVEEAGFIPDDARQSVEGLLELFYARDSLAESLKHVTQ